MTIIVLWIAASALVGWFGRKRVIGFWGFLVLSLIVSPVITGLFLLVSAPGKRYMAETEQRVAASFRSAGFVRPHEVRRMKAKANADVVASVVPHAPPTLLRLAEWWAGVVGGFAVVYWVVGARDGGLSLTNGAFGPLDAVRLSFDIGTLGAGGTVVFDGSGLAWLASLERLVVLVILALIVSSLISSQLAALQAKRDAVKPESSAPPPAAPAPASPLAAARHAEPAPAVAEHPAVT
jgi:hypothetical protein